jgi:hypothetical protein
MEARVGIENGGAIPSPWNIEHFGLPLAVIRNSVLKSAR